MEHLSQVYHIASAINGNTNYDWLLAHEMSHMWWGNCVTERYWTDVWLSESFATYSEAIWMETYGEEQYLDYMENNIMKPYLNSGELFPITDPQTPSELWSNTTYEKGASVLHMLRQLMGTAPSSPPTKPTLPNIPIPRPPPRTSLTMWPPSTEKTSTGSLSSGSRAKAIRCTTYRQAGPAARWELSYTSLRHNVDTSSPCR